MTTSIGQLQEAIAETALDRFLLTFFPHRFTRPFSSIHRKIFTPIEDDSIQKLALAAPRGFGKTTDLIGYAAKEILSGRKRYVVLCGSSGDMATQSLSDNLKWELSENELIQETFGDVRTGEWSKEYFVVKVGKHQCIVRPVGAEQRMRGMLFRGRRPDLIICDDIENDESVLSDYQRQKLKSWFFSSLMNLVDRSKDNWKIAVIGTVLHEDSLLTNLLESKDWSGDRLSVCDDNYQTLWPDFMSTEQISEVKAEYQRAGLLDVFFREYRSLPIARENQVFTQEMFRNYDEAEIRDRRIDTVVICDPARSKESYSSDTAIVAVGIDGERGKVYVRDLDVGQYSPADLIRRVVEMAKRWGAIKLGVETTGLLEYITGPLTQEMMKQCYFAQLIEHKSRAAKEDRVAALQPLYKAGAVYHNPIVCSVLEEQLLSYPRPRKWDAMDVFAYIIDYLPSSFFFGGAEKETREEIEKEYAILNEGAFGRFERDWRIA